ncbi:MFS transporter [Paenarthrobacter sp. DKR-5]|uniref:MFS transporter n=1 Tax=Paenarthrobacter sp. DKR-5 TaxID=2835535 RepID=UPI001BDDBFF7|nr:MFS transporter [Paenarthrobacter sp. DKR-5]MBT1003162.1 MFS transporter [Paenarthrobacter sp. DKR-5]
MTPSAFPADPSARPIPTHPTPPTPAPSTPVHSTPAAPFRTTRRYAVLPQLAGKAFLPVGFLARLPLAMLTVGALTLATATSGSYAFGGLAAGGVGLGSAAGAPLFGLLADKAGQRRALLAAAAANSAAVGLLLTAALQQDRGAAGRALVLGLAVLAGATSPQVGSLARVRWMALTHDRTTGAPDARQLEAALSYESTADELTFVLGPALVGLLASVAAPWLPLALAALLTATLVTAFALHPTHAAVPPARSSAAPAAVRAVSRAVAVPVLAMVCMGTFFGSVQTGLIAFAGSLGVADLAGLFYAVMGVSSAVAALSVAYWPERFSVRRRWLAAAALMSAGGFALSLPSALWPMLVLLFAAGIPVGPMMVTVFRIGGAVAPEGKLGTVMTALASGIVAGTAIGSAAAGAAAQSAGYHQSFLVAAAAAAGLLLLGAAAGRQRARGAGGRPVNRR